RWLPSPRTVHCGDVPRVRRGDVGDASAGHTDGKRLGKALGERSLLPVEGHRGQGSVDEDALRRDVTEVEVADHGDPELTDGVDHRLVLRVPGCVRSRTA